MHVSCRPNGAGKTAFAREYLPHDARILTFLNADLIAAWRSPWKPELAAIVAARLLLEEIERLTDLRVDFAGMPALLAVSPPKAAVLDLIWARKSREPSCCAL